MPRPNPAPTFSRLASGAKRWRRGAAVFLTAWTLCPPLAAQESELWRSWNQPIEPVQVVGPIYYVGANDIAAYLIATDDGHMLIDGGFAETAPLIRDSIAKLGYEIEDVKILLNSHAHLDHAGGLAELKRLSGGRLLVAPHDAELIEAGGKGDFLLGDRAQFPAAKVDQRLVDGQQIALGGVTLTAHITAGHTRGCTSWSATVAQEGRTYDVVWSCSFSSLPEVQLLGEKASYPGIAEDFARTFEVLEALPVDVFLANHGGFFGLEEKAARRRQGDAEAFVDPERYRRYLERGKQQYRERLAAERAAATEQP